MSIRMDKHYDIKSLLKFAFPSILMMLFTSIYGIVDGLFISNFAGATAFAGVNFIIPTIFILGSLGFMVGAGGSAIVAKTRGEGDDDRANRYFTLLVCFAICASFGLSIVGFFLVGPIAQLMGASEAMMPHCLVYGRIGVLGVTALVLQYVFQIFCITAGKPNLGFGITVAAGVTNMLLDALFVGLFGWGAAGAASATVIAECVGGFVPLMYFARPNGSYLHFVRPRLEWRIIGRTCVNGSSEMVTNIAMSLVGMLYNVQLMRYIGENGVAAYGVIMYVLMIFSAILMGYVTGTAPLMSFHYGAQNQDEMRSLFKKSLGVLAVAGVIAFASAEAAAPLVALLFVGYDPELCALTEHAFRVVSFTILLMGYAVYGSSLFTSLGNGLVSAAISFLRTLGFELAFVLLLPLVFGMEGIWVSMPAAEFAAVLLTIVCFLVFRERYGL